MKKSFLLTFLLLSVVSVSALDTLELLNQARKSYDQKDYSRAVKIYTELISSGVKNKEIYYNLGNSYYRLGDFGYARYWWELARRISPRDADIRFNLNFLKQQIKEPPLTWTGQLTEFICGLANLNEIYLCCFLVYIFLCFGLVLAGLKKFPGIRKINWILISLWLIFLVVLLVKMKDELWTRWGITVNPVTEVRNGPGLNNSVALTISSGRKIIILGKQDNWLAVGLPAEGLKGWISDSDIVPLNQ